MQTLHSKSSTSRAHFTIIIIKKKPSHFLCVTWAFSGSDTGHSCSSASGTGLHTSRCEKCGTKIPNSQRVRGKEPSRGESDGPPQGEGLSGDSCYSQAMSCIFNFFFLEFHYRYNTPGQNYFNHSKRSAFAQLRFLNENKNSSPCKYISCTTPSL